MSFRILKISFLVPFVFLQYCSSIFIRPDATPPSNVTLGPEQSSNSTNYNHEVEVIWDRNFLGKYKKGRFDLINRNHFDVDVWKFRHDIVFYSDLAPRKLYSECWSFKVNRRDNMNPRVDYFYQYQCEYEVHDEWHIWYGLQGDNYTATLKVDIKHPKDTGEFVALISNNNTDFKMMKTDEIHDVGVPVVRLTNTTETA